MQNVMIHGSTFPASAFIILLGLICAALILGCAINHGLLAVARAIIVAKTHVTEEDEEG